MERLTFKLQQSEDEKQKLNLKVEKKNSEVHGVINEKNNYEHLLRDRDAIIENL